MIDTTMNSGVNILYIKLTHARNVKNSVVRETESDLWTFTSSLTLRPSQQRSVRVWREQLEEHWSSGGIDRPEKNRVWLQIVTKTSITYNVMLYNQTTPLKQSRHIIPALIIRAGIKKEDRHRSPSHAADWVRMNILPRHRRIGDTWSGLTMITIITNFHTENKRWCTKRRDENMRHGMLIPRVQMLLFFQMCYLQFRIEKPGGLVRSRS